MADSVAPNERLAGTATSDFVDAIRGLPELSVITDAGAMAAYCGDETPFLRPGSPCAVARPTSTGAVAELLRLASQHRIPVVPRGAGSGLAGGANAADGCVVLSLERMSAIRTIDALDGYAVAEPGVLTGTLKEAVGQQGLYYPPDPASAAFCTIGGNVATNAGGLCCVKYGVTRDYVIGLEVVLASGDVIRIGRRTPKGVAGLDLVALFVGSEGTLGVVTEATVRLIPLSPPPTTLVALFPDLDAATAAVRGCLAAPARASLFEFMDRTTLAAVNAWRKMGLDDATQALILIQVDTGGSQAQDEVAALVAACQSAGASLVSATADLGEAAMFMEARRCAYPALQRLGRVLLDDVAVPRSRLGALVAGVSEIADDHGLVIGTFGHVADGNLHPTIVFDDATEAAARSAFEQIVRLALRLGGTATGEHGVGQLKRELVAEEIGPVVLDVQRRIKEVFDPLGILNPGKVL